MKNLITTFALALILSLVSACGGSGTSHSAADVPEEKWFGLGALTELEGDWAVCKSVSKIESQEKLSFRGAEVEYKYTLFASNGCVEPLLEFYGRGSFQKTDTTLDIQLTQFYAKPLSEVIADKLNAEARCGITTWQAKKPQNVSNCSSNSFISTLNRPLFTIFKKNGASSLSLGEPSGTLDGRSSSTRPNHFYSDALLKLN